MGEISSVFVEDSERVEATIGKTIYFGEVLGKHSEIYGPLERSELTLVTDNLDFVKLFEEFKLATGPNPFQYIQEENT